MSDDVDVANKLADEALARTLANRVKYETHHCPYRGFVEIAVRPVDCAECGDPIEPKRREAIAGTKHCAECAAYIAERDRLFNGGVK